MPKQLISSRVPVALSVVEFDPGAREELFLTYTWERQEGPAIVRPGRRSPYMLLIGGDPGEITTHPFGLRLGTWLIQERLRAEELKQAETAGAATLNSRTPREAWKALDMTRSELNSPSLRAHDQIFRRHHPCYRIVGHQGCGDLTMNSWNVAYFNSPLGAETETGEALPTLVCLPEEPIEHRVYSCLVKWRSFEGRQARYSIEEVCFRRQAQVTEANQMVSVRRGDRWLARGDWVEFAISNQQVIRDGALVPVVTNCHQFGDLRHLVQMPNLNPSGPLYPGEPLGPGGAYRPRQYFGEAQADDLWFGEAAFREDRTGNLLRAALSGPVLLPFADGANSERIRGALTRDAYREISSPLAPLGVGDWRFVRRRPEETLVEVFFKRNTYGWTMIGLSEDNRRLLCLACAGWPGKTGYRVEEAAEILLRAGAQQALLMDEGADVFQQIDRGDGLLKDMVPRQRCRLRATFIFGCPDEEGTPS